MRHLRPFPGGAAARGAAHLEPKVIFSRGSFGSWKYEIGNQDHSLMQSVELVDRWLYGSEEKVLRS
jgi:hypothetical protein